MTQDETEIWIADNANNYLRIFDATVMPPTLKTSVKVRDEPGWITFGIDGKLAYPVDRRRRRRAARSRSSRRCRTRTARTPRARRCSRSISRAASRRSPAISSGRARSDKRWHGDA